MADINVYDSVAVSEWKKSQIEGGFGMATLRYRCVDIMGMTKDSLDNNTAVGASDDLIDALATGFNLTHIGVSVPMNTNADAIAARGYAFSKEPATYAAQFHSKIHAMGLGVLWRGTDCNFEAGGLYSFPYTILRNGNRYTYLADPIYDNFEAGYRYHGYGKGSASGDLSSNYLRSGTWTLDGDGYLTGPTSVGWTKYCYFNAPYLRDVTIQAKVKKVGNQQIICRASTDTNFPGYGLQIRNGNEIRIERPGLEALATASKTLAENSWYNMKLNCTGSTISGKVWAVGTTEPAGWDLQATSTTYTSGYCGFSGESSYGKFDDLIITPTKDSNTWLARACDYVNTNISLFSDGDIMGVYPEADAHQALESSGSYNSFWVELKYCMEEVGARNNKVLIGGLNSQNFTGVIQGGRSGSMFSIPQMVPIDHYGSCLGLNKRFSSGSAASQTNVSGTDIYTLKTALSESTTDKCDFIPEKIALNQDIDVYIVNKGTGNWTMVIHNEYDQPVQLPDHTNYSNKTNSYMLTKANSSLVNNAWNTFQIFWDNPDCDHTYHFHLYSTVADGTVRVLTGYSGNLQKSGHQQFKTNASADAIEIDIRKAYVKHGQPIFLQEWGDFWSLDSSRSTPIRTEAQHTEYLRTIYDAMTRLANDGILKGFNYWRATGGTETIMYDADSRSGYWDYKPQYDGTVLQTYFASDIWHDSVGVSEAISVVSYPAQTNLVNVDDGVGVTDVVSTPGASNLTISAGDSADQQQLLGNTSAGFGEWASTRYRGMGFQTTRSQITAISFQLASKGTIGMKVYIDDADADSKPTHAIGAELYSWTITNAQLSTGLTKYTLPVPLNVTAGNQYCFYLSPWNTTNNLYQDSYRDMSWQNANVYSNGKPIVNSAGTWSVSDSGNLDMRFEIYTAGGPIDNLAVSESVTVSTAGVSYPDPLSVNIVPGGILIVK